MWKELFARKWDDSTFYTSPLADALKTAAENLKLPIPADLFSVYSETDGVYSEEAAVWDIWSLDELIKENNSFHSFEITGSFDDLFLFGDLGNGDLAAAQLDANRIHYISFGIWRHETDEYKRKASSLAEYFKLT